MVEDYTEEDVRFFIRQKEREEKILSKSQFSEANIKLLLGIMLSMMTEEQLELLKEKLSKLRPEVDN